MAQVWNFARLLSKFGLSSKRRTRRNRTISAHQLRRLQIESLEGRRLLSANQITFDIYSSAIVIEGTTGNDSARVWADVSGVHVELQNELGTKHATFSSSTADWIRFFGGDGDDRVENVTHLTLRAWGGAGNDVLIGGSGNDDLLGEEGNDQLIGMAGEDSLVGGLGDDTLYGGDGKDGLSGEDGNDALFGQEGDDWLSGAAGHDVISAGHGEDYILGGIGNDTLVGGDGHDSIRGEDGDDTLWGLAGDDVLVGGIGNDSLYGGDGEDSLSGEDGNDLLYGEADNDWMSGAAGNDALEAGSGDDYMLGGVGDDTLMGDDGIDTVYGEVGNDFLSGGGGDDALIGDVGDDTLYGGDGNDVLSAEDGNDQLFGDAGDDWLSGAAGNDVMVGGLDGDYILGGIDDDTLVGGDGNDTIYGEDGDDILWGLAGDDTLVGHSGDDAIYGGDGKDSLSGEDGNDRLFGEAGDDWLSGAAGNEVASGGLGMDYILGGIGNDYLHGGDDDDLVYGNEGNDLIWGWNGDDGLVGGVGDDSLTGGEGEDVLQGEDGNDQLIGQGATDGIWGGAGHDIILAGDGDDFVVGGTGADVLDGGDGIDWLQGGDGNDILFGGLGNDELLGENDDDILVGGLTVHETNMARLQALIFAWGSSAPYESRVERLGHELFSARLQSEQTVFDDGIPDALYGGLGQDWFFQTGHMGVYAPVSMPTGPGHDHGSGHHGGAHIVHELPELEGYALIDSLDKFGDRQSNETIHSLVPHADNAIYQREHLSLFELVRYDQATHVAVKSGDWTAASTWKDGVIPSDGARVLISYGMKVTINEQIQTRIATIRVDGTLAFDAARNTELRVDTVVIGSSGTFEMGTAEKPIAAGVRARLLFTDNGPIDRAWDPFAISRGLISHGKVSIYGAEHTSYIAIASGAVAGSRTLLFNSAPIGWRVGDSIVIAATTPGATENEVRTIVGLAGNSVILDRALTFNHLAPAADLQVHAANTSRNAVFESESAATDRRGHVMFMHSRNVDISFAGFYRLGRTDKMRVIDDSVVQSDWTLKPGTGTNQRARYAVHFHRNGLMNDGNPAVITGSAVVDSPGWGFVNHSSYVDMMANVAYDVHGAAFTTEVGDEIGGFYGNLAIGSTGSGEETNSREFRFQDFGHQGDGFWFQGAGISVVGNIAAGNEGNAFIYYTRGLIETKFASFPARNLPDPSIADGAESIPVGQVPVKNFSQNIGYASSLGLTVRYHLENSTHGARSVIADSQFWNNTNGVDIPYVQNTTLSNLKIISVEPGYTTGISMNGLTGNIHYVGLTVSGYFTGILMPFWGNNGVYGGTFSNNFQDIMIYGAAFKDRYTLITGALNQPRIHVAPSVDPLSNGNTVEKYFVQDVVVVRFGTLFNQRVYHEMQLPGAVPFPTPRADVPIQYVGLTNQQLSDRFGKAIGGAVAPPATLTVPYVVDGYLAPLA